MPLTRIPIGCAGLLLTTTLAQAADPDIIRGERVFRTQCAGCHSVEPNDHRAGPSLYGVLGRPAGSVEFAFSPAMREAELIWTEDTLDAFLADPAAVVPDTWMIFWGLQQPARAQVIRYLERFAE